MALRERREPEREQARQAAEEQQAVLEAEAQAATERDRADLEARIARSRQLVAQALANVDDRSHRPGV